MQVSEQLVSIAVEGGAVLAGTLYLPDAEGPFATLLEALPYRMSDVGASYADGYLRFAGEGGFAVLRIDVRGTGNSTGVAEDEYPDFAEDEAHPRSVSMMLDQGVIGYAEP